jgi:hypothetical protein
MALVREQAASHEISVAAGLVPFAIGSETLGSIVSPSDVCGTTGLRPSFGRVSRAALSQIETCKSNPSPKLHRHTT